MFVRLHCAANTMHKRYTLLSLLPWIFLLSTTLHSAEPLADFTLKSATDSQTFKLSEQRGKIVVLHFLLKTECPICLRHTREYLTRANELPGITQVFIKPDAEAEIKQWSAKISSDLLAKAPIYRDPDATLANALKIPDGYKFHGQTVHYPALIILNAQGEEVFRYVGKNNSDRYAFNDLKQKLEAMKK